MCGGRRVSIRRSTVLCRLTRWWRKKRLVLGRCIRAGGLVTDSIYLIIGRGGVTLLRLFRSISMG